MHRPSRRLLTWLIVLVLLPGISRAQGLTGALVGLVKDSQGGVLSGAVVRIASPALIGGELRTVSSAEGVWRFPVLPPGVYVLSVELPPRFNPSREEGILIGAGATLERTVVLGLAGVIETTSASASVARGSGLESRFRSDVLQTIPTRRFSMFDSIRSAIGVSPTSPASGTVNTVSIFGSGVNENTFLIDGTNFTCPCQGVSRAEPIVDVIEEVHVQSMGASVEYGNLQGGVINVVTRQGSARFTSSTSYYGQAAALTAQPIELPVTRGTVTSSGYERVRYRDFTTNLGGPVVRDRLWFFGAYQHLRDYDSQPGADPAFPRTYEQDKFFGKLNWRLTPSLQLMNSFHLENWVNPTTATLAAPYETTVRMNASVPNMTFAQITHVLSDRTVWEARAGWFLQDQHNDPSSGSRTTPFVRDQITGVSSGNAATIGGPRFERLSAKAVAHRYQPHWSGGDHEFRAGTQLEVGRHQSIAVFPGGVQYVTNNGDPFQAIYRDPSITGGRFVTAALFASDSFTLRHRITIDAGLRYDYSSASSPDLPAIDAEGHETDGVIQGLGHLYTWNVLSPRLGVSARLTEDGRTMLRASYGRFNQGVLTGELDPIHPGVTPTTTMAYEASTGGYTRLVSVVDPKRNLSIDPETRTPHTDEFSLAVDHQIGTRMAASAAYIRKTGSDSIGWTDTGGQYREETRVLTDGQQLPVMVLTNATADRRFLLTNPGHLSMHYDGVVLALDKRLSNRWQATVSYTYSKAYGRQVTSNASASEAQFSTIARPAFLTFGQDPNDLTNSEGRLPNDRPHVFRTNGSAHLWAGVLVAGSLQHFSGRPWAATTQVTLPQGSQRIMLEPRGTRRLSSQTLFDLRVSKSIGLGKAGSLDVILDMLNLLNDAAEEAIQSDNLFATTFGRATQFMDPRRAMIGVRLNVGQ